MSTRTRRVKRENFLRAGGRSLDPEWSELPRRHFAIDIVNTHMLHELKILLEQCKQPDLILHRLPVNLQFLLYDQPADVAASFELLDFFRGIGIHGMVEHQNRKPRAPAGRVIKKVLSR